MNDTERTLNLTRRELQRFSDEVARRDAYACAEASGANPILAVPIMMADARTLSTGRAIEVEYRSGSDWLSGTEYLQKLRADPDFRRMFADEAKPKAPPSSALRNPWLKSDFNLTEQMRIRKSDPDLAARLEAASKR
jgi:hypothetical protein